MADVREMAKQGLIEPSRLLAVVDQIAADFYKYPAISPTKFSEAVERTATALTP